MDVHLVARHEELANTLGYHLKPMGLEVTLHTNPASFVAELDEIDPRLILCNVDDFSREWKPLLRHLRTFRSRAETVFVLLASGHLAPEEAAKATYLGVNGIISEDVNSKRGTHRLLDLLRRYQRIEDKRSFTRYLLAESDRVGLAFIHPSRGMAVTGEVTEVSVQGASFVPDRPGSCGDLAPGTEIPSCSLRVGDRIVTLDCRVRRSGKDLGLQFASFEEGAHGVLSGYIEQRPQRALKAALEASRQAPAGPPDSPDSR